MLHPSVVEVVSATCSGSVLEQPRELAPQLLALLQRLLEVRTAGAALLELRRSTACMASTVARGSGPNVPVFRYA